MARLEERDCVYFSTVRSFCGPCQQAVPARVFFRAGKVWQQSLCPRCTNIPVLIAADQEWYLRETQEIFQSHAPLPGATTPQKGCPSDCGPCSWHAARCKTLQVTASSPEVAHDAVERLGGVALERLYIDCHGRKAAAVLRECMSANVKQVLSRWPGELDHLAAMGIGVVLSPRDADAVARLTAAGAGVELEASPAEAGSALKLLRGNRKISGLTITAEGVPVDEAVRMVCEHSCGELSPGDFRPDDSAHPLCWLAAQYGEPPRTVAVHAVMDHGAFDCFRALLCPHWALARPGLMAPACLVGLVYGGN